MSNNYGKTLFDEKRFSKLLKLVKELAKFLAS